MSDTANFVENIFDNMGLMRGTYAPFKRAVAAAVVTGLGVTLVQPRSMFIDGVPRPWSLLNSKRPTEGSIPPTKTPWYFVPLGCALIAGVFI